MPTAQERAKEKLKQERLNKLKTDYANSGKQVLSEAEKIQRLKAAEKAKILKERLDKQEARIKPKIQEKALLELKKKQEQHNKTMGAEVDKDIEDMLT